MIYWAHYDSAKTLERRHLWLGVPSVVLSGIAGTSIFAAITKTPAIWAQVLVGLATISAAILASLQTFLRLSERAEKHRIAGARFAALHREADQFMVVVPATEEELRAWMTSFREKWDALSEEVPTALEGSWTRAKARLQAAESRPLAEPLRPANGG